MSDLKPTAEECEIGECFLVKLPSKSQKLTAFRPVPAVKGAFVMEKLIFERISRPDGDGKMVDVWRRLS
jgi:hypothetical protein